MSLGLTHLCKDVGALFTLPLGADVCAKTTLKEFQGPLILGDLQQFHSPLLVGGETNHLADQIPDKLGVFGLDPLQPGGTQFVALGFAGLDFGSFVALVEPHGDFIPRSHACKQHVLFFGFFIKQQLHMVSN